MATTTYTMESFDANMIEYSSDMDIPMASGGLIPESWISTEANMDDDSLVQDLDYNRTESVEVDMEANDDELMTEYEMEDDTTHLAQQHYDDTELPDIEVLDDDPSTTLPVFNLIEPTPSVSSQGPLDAEHRASPHPSLSTPSAPFAPLADADASYPPAEEHSLGETTVFNEDASHQPHIINIVANPSIALPAPEATEHNGDQHASPEVRAEPAGEAQSLEIVESAALAEVIPPPGDPQPAAELVPAGEEIANEYDYTVLPTVSSHQLEAPSDEFGPPPDFSDSVHNDVEAQAHMEPLALASSEIIENVGTEAEAPNVSVDEAHETSQDQHSNNDPHEISDGVYIDPPPAVLFSVVFSSTTHEYSLFNRPVSTSGSQSPVTETPPEQPQSLPLLLHDRPTLYYEPLSTVFQALRHEEAIYGVAELADGELILDAYDLQLVVSEDNVHTSEATLHELNIIHDGSDLTGPLRLRLYASAPRFIARYHALREQVARLNLAAEDEAYPEQVPESPEEIVHAHGRDHVVPIPQEDEPVNDQHSDNTHEPSSPEDPATNEETSHDVTSLDPVAHNTDHPEAPDNQEQGDLSVAASEFQTEQDGAEDRESAIDEAGTADNNLEPDTAEDGAAVLEHGEDPAVEDLEGGDDTAPQDPSTSFDGNDDTFDGEDPPITLSATDALEPPEEDPSNYEHADEDADGNDSKAEFSTELPADGRADQQDTTELDDLNDEQGNLQEKDDEHDSTTLEDPSATEDAPFEWDDFDDDDDFTGDTALTGDAALQAKEETGQVKTAETSELKSGKRTFDEAEFDLEDYEAEFVSPPSSPGSKRPRVA